MTTPTLVLCQQLATYVAAAWAPTGADAVDWDFFRRWGDGQDALKNLVGRQVVFFPAEEGYDLEAENRAEDAYRHRVSVLVGERYTAAAGDAPRAWTAARVDFVHTQLVQGLWFRRARPSFNPKLMTESISVPRMYDREALTTANKLFTSQVDLVFLELI